MTAVEKIILSSLIVVVLIGMIVPMSIIIWKDLINNKY